MSCRPTCLSHDFIAGRESGAGADTGFSEGGGGGVMATGGGGGIAPVGEKLLFEHTQFSATRGGIIPTPPLYPPLGGKGSAHKSGGWPSLSSALSAPQSRQMPWIRICIVNTGNWLWLVICLECCGKAAWVDGGGAAIGRNIRTPFPFILLGILNKSIVSCYCKRKK